jgi:hypothetical protein
MLNYSDAVIIAAVVVISLGQCVVIPLIGQKVTDIGGFLIAMAINLVFVAIILRELRSKNDATKIILRELRSERDAINIRFDLRMLRSENTCRMWKLKLKERDEEIRKLTMDNETLAKEVATLKSGIANVQMLWKKYM